MAAPRNIEYYISRIAGYSKNTIKLQPVSNKAPFVSGDVTIFRLPTNAIIDLHTLSLSFDLQIASTFATLGAPLAPGFVNGPARPPRYAGALMRRIDVTAGGVQVGLGSLTDYGSCFSFLAMNTLSKGKHQEMNILENGGGDKYLSNFWDNAVQYNMQDVNPSTGLVTAGNTAFVGPFGTTAAATNTLVTTNDPIFPYSSQNSNTTASYYTRVNSTMWLGLLGGAYMRFLDTNLMPDIEIRITWARDNVLLTTPGVSSANLSVWQPNMTMETIGFADNTYESMVEARLSTNEPIVVPFTNWASYETSVQVPNATPAAANLDTINYVVTTSGTVQQQFTIATQSLNGLYGTMRAGDYDSLTGLNAVFMQYPASYVTSVAVSNTGINTTAAGVNGTNGTVADLGAVPARRLYNQIYNSYYYRFCGFDSIPPQTGAGLTADIFDKSQLDTGSTAFDKPATTFSSTVGQARYQFTVDSKVYPQFQADATECYTLTRNSFDGSGGNRDFASLFGSLKSWYGNAFALGVSFEHNSEDALRDRLVSGLNTNGSNIPITFTANGISLPPTQVNVAGVPQGTSTWLTNTVRPVVFCEMTSTLLIYPGRIISVIN